MAGRSPGQFHPGGVGGPNATGGFVADSLVNPWDYLLMLEGALLFAGAAARRFGEGRGGASFPSPSAPRHLGMGRLRHGRDAGGIAGRDLDAAVVQASHTGRGAASARGRAGTGRSAAGPNRGGFCPRRGGDRGGPGDHRLPAVRPLEAERAELPRDAPRPDPRGWLAGPRGRPPPGSGSLVERLRGAASGEQAPARCRVALRSLERAIFSVCLHGDPRQLQDVVIALGEAEAVLGMSLRFREDAGLRPLQHLSPRWLRLCDDRSSEFRLGRPWPPSKGIGGAASRHPRPPGAGAVRVGRVQWTTEDHAVAWTGHDLERDLAAVLERRMLEAQRKGLESLPVRGLIPAPLAHIQQFLAGRVDFRRLAGLTVALATSAGTSTGGRIMRSRGWNWASRRTSHAPIACSNSSTLLADWSLRTGGHASRAAPALPRWRSGLTARSFGSCGPDACPRRVIGRVPASAVLG